MVAKERSGYQFGDLFINNFTGKKTYQFGDISRAVDSRVKEEVCKLTGKAEYEFGDLTTEIKRRIETGEYTMRA